MDRSPTTPPLDTPFDFAIESTVPDGRARTGLLTTGHGTVATPVFMPVGTQATVKAMSPAEMEDRMEEIVEFADLHAFIDQPIRTYSTGMVARLAFAVATTVDAHILLLDEVLAVGDVSFRQKCRERLEAFHASEERRVAEAVLS